MADPSSATPATATSKEDVAKLQEDLQKGIDWLDAIIQTSTSDTDRPIQLLSRKYDHLTQLLQMQQALMIILTDSFTTTKHLGSETPQELPEKQQELLSLLTKSFTLATKLGQEALDELQSKKTDLELKGIEEQERHQRNTVEQLKPASDTLYDPERRLLEYDDAQQDFTRDFANYAEPSEVPPNRLVDKMAAHRALLFNRAKDVQVVLEHFKDRMSPEMKDKVDRLQTAIEWMRGYGHMDVVEAERIAMGDESIEVET